MSECTFYGEQESDHCGYCGGSKGMSRCTHGATFSTLTTDDYQRLMFRGWRRCGTYCYKPSMQKICCPQYTIRLDLARYQLSRSHRRVLRRMADFLRTGDRPARPAAAAAAATDQANNSNASQPTKKQPQQKQQAEKQQQQQKSAVSGEGDARGGGRLREGKARQKRWAARLAKLRAQAKAASGGSGGGDGDEALEAVMAAYRARRAARAARRAPKTLEQLLKEEEAKSCRHRLRVVLRRSADPDFDSESEHPLYQRYQTAVHGDAPEECNLEQFRRFLCKSSLVYEQRGGNRKLGSFHQQYWLEPESRLIMVGVLDVLPDCTSSVYVFYDPEFAWLNLGTYAALREIAYTRELGLPHYCMGYYLHDCVKMRYKGAFAGSELLCPETYTWHCLRTVCAPLLDAKSYCRFAPADVPNADSEAVSTEQLQVALGRQGGFLPYRQQLRSRLIVSHPQLRQVVEELVLAFARVVGPECVRTVRVRIV